MSRKQRTKHSPDYENLLKIIQRENPSPTLTKLLLFPSYLPHTNTHTHARTHAQVHSTDGGARCEPAESLCSMRLISEALFVSLMRVEEEWSQCGMSTVEKTVLCCWEDLSQSSSKHTPTLTYTHTHTDAHILAKQVWNTNFSASLHFFFTTIFNFFSQLPSS